MTQEAENQLRADRRILESGPDAVDHRREFEAAIGMRLRIEKNLRVTDVVRGGALEICSGHLLEIALLQKHARTFVVDIEKRLQIGEVVRAANLVDRTMTKPDSVAAGNLEHQLRLERAFDVDVQLRFRDRANELFHVHSVRQSEDVVDEAKQREDDRAAVDLARAAGQQFRNRVENETSGEAVSNIVCKNHHDNCYECRDELRQIIEVDLLDRIEPTAISAGP